MAGRSRSRHIACFRSTGITKNLVILAADKDIEHALKGLFTRPEALGIRPIEWDIWVDPQHDPACALRGVDFLSTFSGRYDYGLLIFDHVGSGREGIQPHELQESLNEDFARSPWGERARTIVLSPELEAWVWSDSPHVGGVAGWRNHQPRLRRWLTEQGWLQEGEVKPKRPKEAFHGCVVRGSNATQFISVSADCRVGFGATVYRYVFLGIQRHSARVVSKRLVTTSVRSGKYWIRLI